MSNEPIPSPPEARHSPRLRLPAMYTLVRVRLPDDERFRWTGYIYDVSETGMRFELDEAIEPGTELFVRAMLPGGRHVTFEAKGRVVRLHDDPHFDPGPVRMGLQFDRFRRRRDHLRLNHYLQSRGMKVAA